MKLYQLFVEGGFIMYPLLICSIAIWWVAIDKVWGLSKFSKEFNMLYGKAKGLIQDNKIEEARGLYSQADELIAAPHRVLFDGAGKPKKDTEEKLGRRLLETQIGLKKYLWILGTIGTSAPFIGLFGTVVGIIKSFQTIAETGKSGFSVVAADLSEALIATAAGIIVAVIAVMFYNYFQTKIQTVSLQFKNQLEDLLDVLGQ